MTFTGERARYNEDRDAWHELAYTQRNKVYTEEAIARGVIPEIARFRFDVGHERHAVNDVESEILTLLLFSDLQEFQDFLAHLSTGQPLEDSHLIANMKHCMDKLYLSKLSPQDFIAYFDAVLGHISFTELMRQEQERFPKPVVAETYRPIVARYVVGHPSVGEAHAAGISPLEFAEYVLHLTRDSSDIPRMRVNLAATAKAAGAPLAVVAKWQHASEDDEELIRVLTAPGTLDVPDEYVTAALS